MSVGQHFLWLESSVASGGTGIILPAPNELFTHRRRRYHGVIPFCEEEEVRSGRCYLLGRRPLAFVSVSR